MPSPEPTLSYDDLRNSLDAAGIRVRAVGGALRVTHASRLTSALRTALRVHKNRLLAECALPLWAQVYTVFGGGTVYEGPRKIAARRIARELAALTQPDLEIEDAHHAEESPGLILPLGRTLRSQKVGQSPVASAIGSSPPPAASSGSSPRCRGSASRGASAAAVSAPLTGGGEGVASHD